MENGCYLFAEEKCRVGKGCYVFEEEKEIIESFFEWLGCDNLLQRRFTLKVTFWNAIDVG